MLSFFHRDILDEILDLVESVSEGFSSYYCKKRSVDVASVRGHGHRCTITYLQMSSHLSIISYFRFCGVFFFPGGLPSMFILQIQGQISRA